jgi:hypothetical protein
MNTSRHSNPVLLVLQLLIIAPSLPKNSKALLTRSTQTQNSMSRARTHHRKAVRDSIPHSKQPLLKTWIDHIRSLASQRKPRQPSLKAGREKLRQSSAVFGLKGLPARTRMTDRAVALLTASKSSKERRISTNSI